MLLALALALALALLSFVGGRNVRDSYCGFSGPRFIFGEAEVTPYWDIRAKRSEFILVPDYDPGVICRRERQETQNPASSASDNEGQQEGCKR